MPAIERPLFDGETYEPTVDEPRLTRQIEKVYDLMLDGHWRTLGAIAERVNGTEASVSARLRDLRKPWWGGHTVLRKRINNGLYAYKLEPALCGLLDGQRDSDPKMDARRNIEAFLDTWATWNDGALGDTIIALPAPIQASLTVSDLREMLR